MLSAQTGRARKISMPMRPGWSRTSCARRAATMGSRSAHGPARSSSGRSNAPAGPHGRPCRARPAQLRPFRPNAMPVNLRGRDRARRKCSSSPACRCRRRAGGNGRGMRPGPARRWCCAASARAACPGPRSGSATASAGAEAGVAIDPRLFRLFGVTRVPVVVVVPGGVPPCRSRGCANDPAPAHDRITGNTGLVAALEAVAAEGDAGREAARRHLERLGRHR